MTLTDEVFGRSGRSWDEFVGNRRVSTTTSTEHDVRHCNRKSSIAKNRRLRSEFALALCSANKKKEETDLSVHLHWQNVAKRSPETSAQDPPYSLSLGLETGRLRILSQSGIMTLT